MHIEHRSVKQRFYSKRNNSSGECFAECLPSEDAGKSILWSIRFKIWQVVYLQSHELQYHTQPELNHKWAKVSYKRGRSTQDETERETKHAKDSEHWLNQTPTSNRYTALLEEESEDQQQKAGHVNIPKPPPIYITYVKNISPLIQLLEQIAKTAIRN
jgi:hypothetical protein